MQQNVKNSTMLSSLKFTPLFVNIIYTPVIYQFRVIGEYLSQIDSTLRVNLIQLNFLGQNFIDSTF